MSDILIKRMEMPDCCNTCPCCQRVLACRYSGSYCGATGREIVNQGEINENCPLIEVPKHGRLIDADALMKDGWCLHKQVMRMGGYAIHEMPLNCPSLPIIIEAEDGE